MIHRRAQTKKSVLKNEKGILTLDFLFAIIMMFSFTAILFAFSITFTAVEIAQYATFASARAYFAAHKTSDEQEKVGKNKFNSLVANEKAPLATLFKNGWFTLSAVELKDFNGEYASEPDKDSDTFIGARTTMVAKILKMRFPLLGATTDDDLSAVISSFLMREPTEEECQIFVRDRFNKILDTDSAGRFRNAFVLPGAYVPIMDDGC